MPNKYKVFDTETGHPLFHVEEFNDSACNRVCCAPNHSLFLKFFAVNPSGSVIPIPPLMTMEREGACGQNHKCVCCFSFCDSCRDEMVRALYYDNIKIWWYCIDSITNYDEKEDSHKMN